MEQNSRKASRPWLSSRPWLYGAMFVWALMGAVALTAYSSRPQPQNAPIQTELVPIDSSKVQIEAPRAPVLPTPHLKNPTKIAWEGTFEAAMQRARIEGKPIMIDFYTDWCGWCKELDRQVYPDKNVVSESANWVSIKINGEKRPDVAGAYGVTGYPTVIFAQSSGKPLEVLPGFAPPADFLSFMQAARAKWAKNG